MNREILIGLSTIGPGGILKEELSIDQLMGVLNAQLAEEFSRENKTIVKLTRKGLKVYNALISVVCIESNW